MEYLIKKESVMYVKGDGDKTYIYINHMKDPIVSSVSFDALASQITEKRNVVEAMPHREKIAGKYEEPIQLVQNHL